MAVIVLAMKNRLVVLYCYCMAIILFTDYGIGIVLVSKNLYWSPLLIGFFLSVLYMFILTIGRFKSGCELVILRPPYSLFSVSLGIHVFVVCFSN